MTVETGLSLDSAGYNTAMDEEATKETETHSSAAEMRQSTRMLAMRDRTTMLACSGTGSAEAFLEDGRFLECNSLFFFFKECSV